MVSLPPSTAYLLVSHGSRDPRHQAAMDRLAQLVRQHLSKRIDRSSVTLAAERTVEKPRQRDSVLSPLRPKSPAKSEPFAQGQLLTPMVGIATLESGPFPLHQQIYEFYVRARAAGVRRLVVVPLFLLAGVHVTKDIPAEVKAAQSLLQDSADIRVCSYLGSHPNLRDLLQQKVATAAAESWLLLSHGSRRTEGNRSIENLARALGGTVAFWSVPPDLEDQVITLIQGGFQRLAILPFFLFTGSITDAITRRTEELAERFPQVKFRLLPPLGATPELAKLVCELARGDRRPQGNSRLGAYSC